MKLSIFSLGIESMKFLLFSSYFINSQIVTNNGYMLVNKKLLSQFEMVLGIIWTNILSVYYFPSATVHLPVEALRNVNMLVF